MNRLHFNHTFSAVLLSTGAMTLLMFASVYETCQLPAVDTVRLSTQGPPNSAKPNNVPSHCLIYGKYCLGEPLRSK